MAERSNRKRTHSPSEKELKKERIRKEKIKKDKQKQKQKMYEKRKKSKYDEDVDSMDSFDSRKGTNFGFCQWWEACSLCVGCLGVFLCCSR